MSAEGAPGQLLWRAIVERGTTMRLAPGSPLLHQGDGGTHCYAIIEGEVLITTITTQGATVVLNRHGPGAVVGELAALDGGPRSATATARTAVTVVSLSAAGLEALLREQPDLAMSQLRRLSREVRMLSERYTFRHEDLGARLANLLATHLEESGDPTFRSTRQELADWVGATREAVTRTLRRFEDEGAVALARNRVTIVDRQRLAKLSLM